MNVHEFVPSQTQTERPSDSLTEPRPINPFAHVKYLYRPGEHNQYPWKTLPWPGITKKVLFFDPISGISFELFKMIPGTTFPEHYLTTTQSTYLLEGRLRREDGTLIQPGSFYFVPAGEVQLPIKAETLVIELRYFDGVPVSVFSDGSTFISKSDGSIVAAGNLTFVGKRHPPNITSTE